jgi:hypothetical protein
MSMNDLIQLNLALNEFQANKEVDDIVEVKNAGAKVVAYEIKSKDRSKTRDAVEAALKKYRVGTVTTDLMAMSSFAVTNCKSGQMTYRFIYKPIRGGMSQTTLNASITELFPCIAFETGIKSNQIKNVKDFYNKIIENNSPNLNCYLNAKDAAAGKEFIDKAETGKFQEKVQNAINVLRWIEAVNKKHPIEKVYWGYRAKPQGVMANHPGDIFLYFGTIKGKKQILGVSLKAGGETTDEPKLNTYVKPIFDFYGKTSDYEKLKDKLWPQYAVIPGITDDDKKLWGTQALARKTYAFEQQDEQTYNELYDKNLEIIKDELIKLLNSNFSKTKSWLLEKVAQQQQDVPLVVVKTTMRTARRDKSSDLLVEALAAADTIIASKPEGTSRSKQAWNIVLDDGITVQLDFTTRTNKVGAMHKMGQFSNLAVKFNKVKKK